MELKLSIIIPVFNSSNLIKKCLNSIKKQLSPITELIIIDDASTDNSFQIIKKYSQYCKFIKIIRIKKNLGAANTRNVGINASTGEYICFLDSDDKLRPGAIKNILFNIKIFPNKDLYVLRNYITSKRKNELIPEFNSIDNLKNKKKSIINCISNFNTFRPTCWNFIFNKRFLNINSISFNSNIKISEDWPFTSKALCLCSSFQIIKKPTHIYQRLRPSSLGTTTGYIWVVANLKIINEINTFLKNNEENLNVKKIKFLKTIIERANSFVFSDILICSNNEIKKISKYFIKFNNIIPYLSSLGFKGLNQFYKKSEKQIFIKLINYKSRKIMNIKKKFYGSIEKKIILFCAGRAGSIASNILKDLNFKISMFIDNNDNFSLSYVNKIKINNSKYLKRNLEKLKNNQIIICDNKKHVIKSITGQVKKIGFKDKNIFAFDMI